MSNAVDGLLTDAERLELERLLDADPEALEKWRQLIRIEAGLRSARVRFPFAVTVPQAIRAEHERRVAQGVLQQIRSLPDTSVSRSSSWLALCEHWFRPIRRRTVWATGFVAIAILSTLIWLGSDNHPRDLAVEQARNLEVRRGWWWRSVKAGEQLSSRWSLRTGPLGSARLQILSDSTTVVLEEQTKADFIENSLAKQWSIKQGRIQVHAAHQVPGHPIVVRTPHGHAEVVGTTFSLSARPTTSWLRVDDGAVQWSSLGDNRSLLVPAGQFVAAGHGPIGLLMAADPEMLRIPFTLDLQRSFQDGDGAWNTDGSALVQTKVSHVPMTNAIWGTPASPGSAYVIEARTPESIEIRCDVEVQRTIHDEVARWIWPQNFGLRFYLGRYDFQLNAEGGGVAGTALLKFGGGSPKASDSPVVIHGQTHSSLPAAGVGLHHFRLQLWRQPDGHCRALGKVWTGSGEPNEWQINAEFNRSESLTQVGMQTVSCAARFSQFQTFLIESLQ